MYTCTLIFRLERLTWHEDVLPTDEIWVKLGGGKGGGSFKMNFQIVNVPCPNAPHNTCVFSIFETPDTILNLQVVTDRVASSMADLATQSWK